MSKRGSPALVLILLTLAFSGPSLGAAQQDDDDDAEELTGFRRKTPSSQYVDPASFFRFHGYVTLVLSEAGEALGREPGRSRQILVSGISPRTGVNHSGFSNDVALFIGGEPLDGVGTVVELHLVGNSLDPVLTEAKISWDILGEEEESFGLRLIGGRYWWPFGIHNEEWFSALNRFSLLSPAASEVVPAHYNEVGLMSEGELRLSPKSGLNFSLSVGNGTPSFELMDNVRSTPFDHNDGRTLTGSAEYVVRRRRSFTLGFSGSRGDLRSGLDETIDPGDPRRFPADFHALGFYGLLGGADETGAGLRAYYYLSRENLEDAETAALDRDGFTIEPDYSFRIGRKQLQSISIFGRYGLANEDRLDGGRFRWTQWGAGIELEIKRNLLARFAYVAQGEEGDAPAIDNDVFTFSFSAEF